MMVHMGHGSKAPHILDLYSSWRYIVSIVIQLLYTLDRRLVSSWNHTGCSSVENICDKLMVCKLSRRGSKDYAVEVRHQKS